MSVRKKLEGLQFGDFVAIRYIGNKRYLCKCVLCGEEKELYGNNLSNCRGTICSLKKVEIDLTGQQIGDWTVIKYVGNKKYLCRCSCENQTEREVLKCNLLNGSSTSCGHNTNRYGDLTGKRFGDWLVLEKEGYKWKCECQCSKKTIGYIMARDLVLGKTKSCGHDYNEFVNISGQQFGLWLVLEYIGNQYYKCECQCKNKTIRNIRKADLLSGATTSCGCNKASKIKEALYERYGEVAPNKIKSPRNANQLNAVSSRDNLLKFIQNLSYKPTSIELSRLLNIGLHRTLTLIHDYELDDYIIINDSQSSAEKDIIDYIKKHYKIDVIERDRNVLKGKELDIYIPSKKIAIEFNGIYWHSTVFKDKYYHQQKTIDCAKQGIRLIHIFEYEWLDEKKKNKILKLIDNIISEDYTTIAARNCIIKEIGNTECKDFLDRFHLQESAKFSVGYGLYNNGQLVSVMTFGKPRFNNGFDYEIIRYCTLPGTRINGGAERLFKHFIKDIKPESVITYCDISKFTGNVYTKLGFKPIQPNPITDPNYVWYNVSDNQILHRYDTMKHKLVEQGLGSSEQTESEIMSDLNYLQIYDSGNLRLEWNKKN